MVAVKFERVNKVYSLQKRTLRQLTLNLIKAIPRRLAGYDGPVYGSKVHLALKDINFEIYEGESFGIIGPNGSGKTTLLKLISRITSSSSGQIHVRGRVAPLIQLGAGFHPQLTGRDNIYLNASILGLSRKEINAKIPLIIDFSELGEFIDVPVKKYSSGMYARLGFSVAVHTDPEILLVDEVLSVGDALFQRKCHDKILELKKKGMTIVYVSHNLTAVKGVCERALFINQGQILSIGQVDDVIQEYQSWVNHGLDRKGLLDSEMSGYLDSGEVDILKVSLLDGKGNAREVFEPTDPLTVHVEFTARKRIANPVFGIGIIRSDGLPCCGFRSVFDEVYVKEIEGPGVFELEIEKTLLQSGKYSVRAFILDYTLNTLCGKKVVKLLIESKKPNMGHVFIPQAKWRVHAGNLQKTANSPQEGR